MYISCTKFVIILLVCTQLTVGVFEPRFCGLVRSRVCVTPSLTYLLLSLKFTLDQIFFHNNNTLRVKGSFDVAFEVIT